MAIEQIQLTLSATGLKNVAGIGKGTSDPFAIVTLLATGPGAKPKVLGKTEVIKNQLSPKWTTSFLFDYEFGKETHINISVVDEVRKTSDKPMGSAVFEIGDIMGSRGSIKAKKLKKGGTLYVRLQKAAPRNAGKLALRLRGDKLKNVDGLFQKSDPFYELSRTYDGPSGGSYTPVYRSKQVKNNLNPKWEPATIDVGTLCDGALERKIQVAVYDYEKDGKHESMGTFETTVNELVKASGNGNFTLTRKRKNFGTIIVDQAQITGADDTSSSTTTAPVTTSAAADPSVLPVPVPQMANMDLGRTTPGAVPVPAPQQSPTFVDYITGNCVLTMTVAIDFTGSNGDPRRPGTLHHFSQQLNGYEKAITAVGGILSKYDSDQNFAVVGFGAKYGGIVRHCFQVGKEKECHGVRGILDAYRGVFKTPLIMSGPTVFTEAIQLAAAQAKSRHQANPLSYSILLLLTDGAVTDIEATKQVLASVADAPLSIVIVGIGSADFSAMQFLDDFERRSGMQRDIVQFVQFSKHEFDKTSLTRATLDEIPDQLVQFFVSRGIMPQANTDFSASRIAVDDYDEEVDIDLSMDYAEDGEIVLNGDQPAAYVNNSYSVNVGGLQVMPPPTVTTPGFNPHAASAPPTQFVAPVAPPQPVMAMAASLPVQPQPFSFQVQVPPGVSAGQQLQLNHPQTGLPLLVTVPAGIPPGGIFSVSA